MTWFGRWWRSLRAYSFPASLVPVALAAALVLSRTQSTDIDLSWWTILPFALSALLFHAGTNVLNDYYDFVHGVDRLGDADPTHAVTQGVVSARFMLVSGRIYFLLGVLVGSVITLARGPIYLAAGLAGALGAFFYTSARFSLKYRALGDIAVFLLMGPALVLLGVWAVTGTVTVRSVVASLPIALLVTAILHGNNTRDIEADRAAGIDTVAIRLGQEGSPVLFAGLIVLAFLTPIVAVLSGLLPVTVLGSLLTLPLAYKLVRRVQRATAGSELIDLPLRCAQLHLSFGLLYAAGVAVHPLLL